jgi:hypothetical protein
MSSDVPFGIPGLSLAPGDHVCAFYRGRVERDEMLLPFLAEGLRAGDKCICVVDAADPQEVITTLGGELDVGDVGGHLAEHRLEMFTSEGAYLRQGRFSPASILEFWDRAIAAALGPEEFTFVRVVGEMSWALRGLPGSEALFAYEAELNRFAVRYPQVMLCLYDLERFGGEVLMDVLKTHPKILVDGFVVENPYYLEPDEFLLSRV